MIKVRPFHEVFLSRIKSLDIHDLTAVVSARQLADDAAAITIPAKHIEAARQELAKKLTDAGDIEAAHNDQVVQELSRAIAGVESQIEVYRQQGELIMLEDQAELQLHGGTATQNGGTSVPSGVHAAQFK